MIRWIAMLALASACSPAPPPDPATILCERVQSSCPFIIEIEWLWREIPDTLAPGEAVVEAEFVGGSAELSYNQSTTWSDEDGELACTEVTPVLFDTYRVKRVVRGEFSNEYFVVEERPVRCSDYYSVRSDRTLGQRNLALAHGYEGPFYMVIRPSDPPAGLEQWEREAVITGPPIMTLRHNCDPRCQPHTLEPPPN